MLVRIKLTAPALVLLLIASLALAPGASAKAKGFKYGVTATDVGTKGATLWARAGKRGKAAVAITHRKKGGLRCPLGKRAGGKAAIVKAKKQSDLTVQTRVGGLRPGTHYRYRWCMKGGKRSVRGRFSTAPKANQAKTIRFALAGDQDARAVPGGKKPYWNNFGVWKQIRDQGNDFNVLMGDTIYSDTEVPGYKLKDVAISVKQKWAAYKTNLKMKRWTRARGSAAYYAHWDDHEFVNDFSREENSFPYSNDGVPQGSTHIDGDRLYKNGVRAFEDYIPAKYSK
jgi:alkaline phosphatase D